MIDRIEDRARLGFCAGALLLATALFSGCAAPTPPRDLGPRNVAFVQGATAPAINSGPSGAGKGAGRGAIAGVGTGVVAGGALCLATGPYFPLCWAAIIPASTLVGTAGGAAAGAVAAESEAAAMSKVSMLKRSTDDISYQSLLATNLQRLTRDRLSAQRPVGDTATGDSQANADPTWLVEVWVKEISTDSNSEGQPFAIWVEAHVSVRPRDAGRVIYEMDYSVTSDKRLTFTEWSTDDSDTLRVALDRSSNELAEKILRDLIRPPGGV